MMKQLIFSLLILSVSPLSACPGCVSTKTKKNVTTVSHSSRSNGCNCPCTAKRYDDGTCSKCRCKVVSQQYSTSKKGKKKK